MIDKIPIPPRKRSMFVDKPQLAPVLKLTPAKPEKPKGGRPVKHPDKPWEAEGISRMTWYRRQKAKAGASE